MKSLRVFAPNGRVPMEHQMGWIGQEPVQVNDSYYYRQMLACESLELAPSDPAPESSAWEETPLTDEETDGH